MDALLTISAISISSKLLVSTIIESIIIARKFQLKHFNISEDGFDKTTNDPEYPPWPV